MSVSQQRATAVVDAGLKAVALDSGPPQLLEGPNVAMGLAAAGAASGVGGSSSSSSEPAHPPVLSFEGVEYANGGDEHGKLLWPQVPVTACALRGCTLMSHACSSTRPMLRACYCTVAFVSCYYRCMYVCISVHMYLFICICICSFVSCLLSVHVCVCIFSYVPPAE